MCQELEAPDSVDVRLEFWSGEQQISHNKSDEHAICEHDICCCCGRLCSEVVERCPGLEGSQLQEDLLARIILGASCSAFFPYALFSVIAQARISTALFGLPKLSGQ